MSDYEKITKLPKPVFGGISSAQKIRPPATQAVQEFLFKKMPTSVYISRRFVKKMLIIGISEVCRKRLCFPEEEFIIRLAGDMKVKVINPFVDNGKNESVTLIKKWIRKIFEWTENGWIDKVAITIGTGELPSEKPLEIYAFSMKDKELCRKVDEHEIIDLTQEEDTKLQADAEDLLQGLKKHVRPARDLPDNSTFSLQVVKSKNAPKDLKIDDFHPIENAPSFKKGNVFLKRQVQTKFHRFGVVGVEAADSDENIETHQSW
ncbi:unnamed protein product [Oikopleura dioica]|uniref:HORMA domain-containing protein n=1 Tax=Oikopleura dioica TaxID=34765 RepID=E4X381_OIKDI|nr:unnamed protein product [Oikopleura dioica]